MSTGTKARSEFQQGKQKQAKSPKPKRPCMPTKIGLHAFTSISTGMNFLSPFYFLTLVDSKLDVHGPKGKFEGKQKG